MEDESDNEDNAQDEDEIRSKTNAFHLLDGDDDDDDNQE